MNILLAGVGGQGVLFVTAVLTEAAVRKGSPLVGAETHGMAQRGGSVVSHLKLDQEGAAPLIRPGAAHLLLGFDESEGLRCLDYLRQGGRFLVNEGKGKLRLSVVQGFLEERRITAKSVPATHLARDMGFPMGANLILLGAAQALDWLPFSQGEMEKAVRALSNATVKPLNLKSLRCGWKTVSSPSWRG